MKRTQTRAYRATVAIAFGLIGFGVNLLDVRFVEGETFKISILAGLFFPLVVALAWGWRYGLLSALAGGCQAMWWLWRGDGWGVLYSVPVFTLWIVWHGWWAERRSEGHPWHVASFAVEIPFRIVIELGFLVVFRWLVSLNPPPWNPAVSWNQVSSAWLQTVAIKHTVTAYILLLAAYVALSLGPVRRFFGLAPRPAQRDTTAIYAGAALFGLLLWTLDALVHCLAFPREGQSFWGTAVHGASAHEVFMRTVHMAACMFAAVLLVRLNRRRAELRQLLDHRNRVLMGIRNVNQLIVTEGDPRRLIEQACVNMTRTMGYPNAWIALLGGEPGRDLGLPDAGPVATAAAGFRGGFGVLRERLERGEFPRCMNRALESGDVLVIDNPATDCPGCPLHGEYGGRAGLARRLAFDGTTYGILTASVPTAYARDAEEQALFGEVAGDLAFALHKIATAHRLEESRQHLDLVIDGSGTGIWEWNVQTNETVFSDQWAAMLGCTVAELTPCDHAAWERLVHPDDLERTRQALTDCVAGRTPDYSCEFRMKHKDDRWVWILDRGRVMKRDAEGNPVSVFGTHTDITEIKQAEESLRRSEGKYRNLFETMAEGVVYQDAEGNITSANPAAERILGLSLEQMQGKTSSDPRWKAVDEHGNELPGEKHPAMVALRTGKRVENHVQGILIPEKNEYVWILVNSTPQFSEGRDEPCQVYSTFTDITERQKLQAQFAQAQKMESVGRLAGGVAHDFNNVLMGVMGYADLCRETVGTDHPVRPWLDEIVREARRSANLTGQLLAFARKQTIAPQVLDLNDAVGDMLKMLRRLIGEDIDLAWQPGAELWPVRMDPGQVNQILANLCVNARDAIEGTGKVTIETGNVSIDQDYCRSHAYFQPGEYVMLAVSDDGCGMDRQTMDSIFEPFFTTKGVGEGTGLGLATVYGIVKQSEGFINVYSEPGRGTTFRIYLRRVVAETAEKAHERPPESQLRGTETVLLVEDEKSIRVTLSLFLEGLGYTVLTADSPGEGLRLAAEHGDGVDLLVTDVVMPGMSGRELAEELAPDYPAMGVLYMSGYTANVIAHRGILEENVHFLSKPVSRDALARKVREVLDGERIPTQMDPGSGPVDT